MISPVSQPESSEARNTATLAMSAGVPMRPRASRRELLLELASRAQQPGRLCALAERGSGVDGVHPDFSRGQFLGQHARDGVEACSCWRRTPNSRAGASVKPPSRC